uniref:Uncharacterized protein LOC104230605 isoform X2 n=1 Tax=Nicotiana sylvestris TaxID=4096 RepID=A0A1U7WP98_NICSY|nr:PREDICTED: uncharacterized protein LOC104230605 isoform X2 [Nicotiana sylvestris]
MGLTLGKQSFCYFLSKPLRKAVNYSHILLTIEIVHYFTLQVIQKPLVLKCLCTSIYYVAAYSIHMSPHFSSFSFWVLDPAKEATISDPEVVEKN